MDALAYLMSAYFHQDWDVDGGTVADTVDQFAGEPADLRRTCADQIDELVRRDLAEGALRDQLVAWGCDYRPGDTDEDHRRWLLDIREQILASLPS
ncbi:MAG TPA: contact-dependent growth inhibition system immunity protein [Nocardioides sp.]|jgi:hypothetical protein